MQPDWGTLSTSSEAKIIKSSEIGNVLNRVTAFNKKSSRVN